MQRTRNTRCLSQTPAANNRRSFCCALEPFFCTQQCKRICIQKSRSNLQQNNCLMFISAVSRIELQGGYAERQQALKTAGTTCNTRQTNKMASRVMGAVVCRTYAKRVLLCLCMLPSYKVFTGKLTNKCMLRGQRPVQSARWCAFWQSRWPLVCRYVSCVKQLSLMCSI